MALHYTGTTIGTLTLVQQHGDEEPRKYKIQIRESNAFAAFLHIYKKDNPENPKMCWVHTLVNVFVDEQHLRNCLKMHDFEYWFSGKLKDIKLNIYYKEMEKLAKYMAKDGLQVKVYYKEPKNK